ncbi:MAG: ABC transporter ATP-binding protein [Desulfobacterales bacterium]
MDRTEIIEVRNLIKRYNGILAVGGISFSVRKGEFFGLLGPNGAGKTTTIRMLYGFSPPTQGDLRLFGMDITRDWRKIKSRIGVCQQDNTLDPDLTVEQNLLVFASYFSIPWREARDRAAELLKFFALSHRKDAKVMDLSGGMARRLILARALINEPDILVLDEPTTGLDPQSRHQVWEKLEALKSRGLTVLITTHYMEEAARLCDRLVIIDHGRILVEGTPRALIEAHAGSQVIEIDGPDEPLRAFVREASVEHDDLGDRLVVFAPEGSGLGDAIRDRFCAQGCAFRSSTLEDVFLRLTGRELRE